MSIEDKIKEIEEELRKTPYNKATQHHIGKLKAKLAKLRAEKAKITARKALGIVNGLKKTGDATIILCGFPSVGKSTLLNVLTDAKSLVSNYDFTTLKVIPGIMKYKGAKIQLIDVPGLIAGAASGKGRGKEVLSVIRAADLVILVVDAQKPEQFSIIEKELYEAGLRLNQEKPQIIIKKKIKGGIHLYKTNKVNVTEKEVQTVLSEFSIHNADVYIRNPITLEELIDVVAANRKYIPAITVINKIDLVQKVPKLSKEQIEICATQRKGIGKLREKIFEKLSFIRIYLKPQGGKADMKNPLIMHKNSTVKQLCERLHKDFVKKFRYAQISGPSAKHKEQKVGLNHILKDTDIVTIVIKN